MSNLSTPTLDMLLDESLLPKAGEGEPEITAAMKAAARQAARQVVAQAILDEKSPEEVQAAGSAAFVQSLKKTSGMYDVPAVPVIREVIDPMGEGGLITLLHETSPAPAVEVPVIPFVATPEPVIGEGEYDAAADARIAEDRQFAAVGGLITKEPIYQQGSRVNTTGVANATAAREEFDKMAPVADLCDGLSKRITDEQRRIVVVDLASLSMTKEGLLVVPNEGDLPLSGSAFDTFLGRIGCGGRHYLANDCEADLRAHNINAQISYVRAKETAAVIVPAVEIKEATENSCDDAPVPECSEPEPVKIKQVALRIREHEAGKHVFACVSKGYAKHDVDEIAQAVKMATEGLGMRGEMTYDGFGMRLNAFGHSTVQPEHFAAGEIFRVGVQISAKDDGTGAIRIRVCLSQNLCLNLIILHHAVKSVGVFRHRGKPEDLAAKVKAAIEEAVKIVKPFLDKWNRAQNTNVVTKAKEVGYGVSENPAAGMRDVFRGVLTEKLVTLPIPREGALDLLMRAWQKDASSATALHSTSLAAVINAFTRVAHEEVRRLFPAEPWLEDAIQEDASALLDRKVPLPAVTLEEARAADGRRKAAPIS